MAEGDTKHCVNICKRYVEKGMHGRQENGQQNAAKGRKSRALKDTKR